MRLVEGELGKTDSTKYKGKEDVRYGITYLELAQTLRVLN